MCRENLWILSNKSGAKRHKRQNGATYDRTQETAVIRATLMLLALMMLTQDAKVQQAIPHRLMLGLKQWSVQGSQLKA
jgi:hypothetical protein